MRAPGSVARQHGGERERYERGKEGFQCVLSFQGSTQTVSMTRSQGIPARSLACLTRARTRVEQAEHELVAGEVERTAEAAGLQGRLNRLRVQRRGAARPRSRRARSIWPCTARAERRRRLSQTCPRTGPGLWKRGAADETPESHGDRPPGVPDPGPAHCDRRRHRGRRRRAEAARAARAAAAEREPRRLARPADRRAVRGAERQLGRPRAAQPRLAAAEGSRPGRRRRAAARRARTAATCCASSPASSTSSTSSGSSRRGARRSRPATPRGGGVAPRGARRCGTGGRSPISSSSRSRGSRSSGSRSCGWRPSRSGSTPSSRSAAISRSSPSSRRSAREHPYRERFRAQLMLALYRSRPPGRGARGLPADASAARRRARARAGARAAGARAGDPRRRTRR